jgi:hypothetical protein
MYKQEITMGINKNIDECRLVVEYYRVCDKQNAIPAFINAGHCVRLTEYTNWDGDKNFKIVHYSNYFKSEKSAMAKLEKLKKQFSCNKYIHEVYTHEKFTNCQNLFLE